MLLATPVLSPPTQDKTSPTVGKPHGDKTLFSSQYRSELIKNEAGYVSLDHLKNTEKIQRKLPYCHKNIQKKKKNTYMRLFTCVSFSHSRARNTDLNNLSQLKGFKSDR